MLSPFDAYKMLQQHAAAHTPAAPHIGTSGLGGYGGFKMLNPPTTTPSDSANFTYSPDYGSLIHGSPEYQAAKQASDQNNLVAASTRQQAIRNALIHFGSIPTGLNLVDPVSGQSLIDEDVNQETRDQAGANTMSTMHQLADSHTRSLADLHALLASQGNLGGGQDTLDTTNEGKGYASAVDSAQQSLFDILHNALSDYTNTYTTGQTNLGNAAQTAAGRLSSSNAFDPVDVRATRDNGFTYNGNPVYRDANGSYWSSSHQPISQSDLKPVGSAAPPPVTPPPPPPPSGNASSGGRNRAS